MNKAIMAFALAVVLSLSGCGTVTRTSNATLASEGARFESTRVSAVPFIVTDTETGVQYLFVSDGYDGGLTVLVDDEGRPLVKKTKEGGDD